ncbi:ergosterol biosynthesis ERG4/ERG24 [Aspergillus leporis]|uniref:7-dehydrocholesterol reductase n=1 Tax=Aspergillus leporis TaxID=41062 RepID=A0A5N5WXN5_9EURO|nr:ergosterol biosynthesis ERG4/ERG24 [Aspergillus leporis]
MTATICWLAFQAVLYHYLPGPTNTGQRTPAGHLLTYRMNDPAFISRNWEGLFAAMNLAGFLLSLLAYLKAYLMPTHPEDRKFSGCALYDFYMGIELNPRIGDNFDLKLYTNGRPGLIAWTLVDLSNIAYHYQIHHHSSPSLILVTILHGIYVLDFFINEAWYLRTIDIAHDHYGFYLAWGCLTWVPSMYTLQTQFLGLYPTSASPIFLILIFSIGIAGYAFGWWGWSRHANYVGDLLLSFAICALVHTTSLLVWFYIIFMAVLLVHRCLRDEERGQAKYGVFWEEYCRKVPWRLVPGIW